MENEEIGIRRLLPGDLEHFIGLIGLFREVFETGETGAFDEPYLEGILENPGFVAFAIFHNGKVLGGATAHILPGYSSKSRELFIYDLAIHPNGQRSGLGTNLVSSLKNFCMQNGIGEMFVAAHMADTHALNFYKSTGGIAERVVHFNYSTRE